MWPNNNISQQFDTICKRVRDMQSDPKVKHLADLYGLAVVAVAWEDSARTKNSPWGPCISDMTLQVGPHRMPLIRNPNFEDLSWDVGIEKIPLVVGNEIGSPLYTVSLKEYLSNFRTYLNKPSGWKGSKSSLLAPRDSHVIMTAQACFLPVLQGAETEFNVSVYNYQSRKDNPAVLSIVATSQGTSAQVLDSGDTRHGQNLFFNKNGEKCPFVAQRLSDFRALYGQTSSGPMSQQEKQDNMVVIIQVPLRESSSNEKKLFFRDDMETEAKSFFPSNSFNPNVEEAIIRTGDSQGKFVEFGDYEVERDPNFPVRVTLQYYKTTDNGVIDDNIMRNIASQLEQSRKKADAVGSLVVGGDTKRPTEHQQPPISAPAWWGNFWSTYRNEFPNYSEEQAKRKLFQDGRFDHSTMSASKDRIFAILKAEQKPLDWNY